MFQEIATQSDPETLEKAVTFGAVGYNFILMMLIVSAVLAAYALKSIKTSVATIVWVKANWLRFVIGAFLTFVLAILLEVSPNVTLILQMIGFNVDHSPAALACAIGLLIIGATSEPSKNPEG